MVDPWTRCFCHFDLSEQCCSCSVWLLLFLFVSRYLEVLFVVFVFVVLIEPAFYLVVVFVFRVFVLDPLRRVP